MPKKKKQTAKSKPRKTKWNWEALKIEFLLAEEDYVLPFLKRKGIVKSNKIGGQHVKITKGWALEKYQARMMQLSKARLEIDDKNLEELKMHMSEVLKQKWIAVRKALELIYETETIDGKRYITPKLNDGVKLDDVLKIIEMLKTEAGEPNSVSSSFNMSLNVNRNANREEMSEKRKQEIKRLEQLFFPKK